MNVQNTPYAHTRKPEYTLILPWPPTVNSAWRTIPGRSGPILSKPQREYRVAVARALASYGSHEAIASACHVCLTYHPPTARRGDVDNRAKSVLDALTKAGFWLDDNLVVSLLGIKSLVFPNNGRVIVDVWLARPDETCVW